MKIIAIQKHPDKVTAQNLGVEWVGGVVDLHYLLKRAEYLFICIPLTAETRNMISKRELALLPKGAFILNAARGSIINKQALMQALGNKHLGGVALDVYWKEPPKPKDPILNYPNVLVTPHIAGVTDISYQGISIQVKENIIRVMEGRLPLNCANPGVKLKGFNQKEK
jgi:phosphoglycerate dehydrogenase-like enzyme